MMFYKAVLLTTTFLAATALTGCHSPGGGLFASSGGSQTYTSNEIIQKTVTIVDVRTNEPFFTIDIPPGKQLCINFDAGDGDDPVHTPDLLRYEVVDRGKRFGKLHNSLSVPNAASRRIDVDLHHSIQYAAQPPERQLRTDELIDRPVWWTPQGGPMPKDERTVMYDH